MKTADMWLQRTVSAPVCEFAGPRNFSPGWSSVVRRKPQASLETLGNGPVWILATSDSDQKDKVLLNLEHCSGTRALFCSNVIRNEWKSVTIVVSHLVAEPTKKGRRQLQLGRIQPRTWSDATSVAATGTPIPKMMQYQYQRCRARGLVLGPGHPHQDMQETRHACNPQDNVPSGVLQECPESDYISHRNQNAEGDRLKDSKTQILKDSKTSLLIMYLQQTRQAIVSERETASVHCWHLTCWWCYCFRSLLSYRLKIYLQSMNDALQNSTQPMIGTDDIHQSAH